MASTGEVYRYWQAESCGTEHASCATGTRAYYDEIEAARYGLCLLYTSDAADE